MNIGIDFSTFESHDQAYADSWSALPAGFAPDRSAVEPQPVRMQRPNPAFGLYYDNETSEYMMRDPLVVAEDGGEVACSVPARYEPGKTYYCEVVRDGGTYAAKVTDDPTEEPSPPGKLVWRVRLFIVPASSAEPSYQFHTGAVTVSGSNPCRVDSIDDATYSVPTGMEDTGQVITVNYTKAGDGCDDSEETSFTIPILRTKGGGGGGGGGDFSMDVTDEDVAGTQDHPNGGVKVTLSPSAGQGTNFTVWNGKDGKDGKDGENGVDGSDAVVDAYSERIPGSPGRTHVTLTPNNGGNQTQFDVPDGADGADASVDVESVDVAPSSDHPNGGIKVTLTPNAGAGSWFNVWNGKDGASVSSVDVDGEPYTDGEYTITRLRITFGDGRSSTVEIPARTGGLSGTISFVSDVRYDYGSHSIQKQVSTANLATGVVNVGRWTTVDGGVAASHNSDIKD